jgi:hypothetical protein
MLQWVYSKVQYFNEYLAKWNETLVKDVDEKEQIEKFIKQLENPFGFLETVKDMEVANFDEPDDGQPKTKLEQAMIANDEKYKAQEMKLVKSFDNFSNNIAHKLGFSYVPWFTFTKIVLAIYTINTCFVCFYKPDFVNLTICTSAIYMLHNTDKIRRWTFRVLVLGILLSELYDLFWFMVQDVNADISDGGIEKAVKNFSLIMSYFSFFFRLIVALVFWKDSLDFVRIIKQ